MTDEQIIKAMQCVIGNDVSCSGCEYQKILPFPRCRRMCAENALDLIKRQKAEIKRLKKELELATADKVIAETHEKSAKEMFVDITQQIKTAKSEAIREFAERLCKRRVENDPVVIATKAELDYVLGVGLEVQE